MPTPDAGRLTHRWPARRSGGVNLAGFLDGRLGLGESARLMSSAFRAADIPYSTVALGAHLGGRRGVEFDGGRRRRVYDTTLICVNADLTRTAVDQLPARVASGYRIGMWYWEVEAFPAAYHGAFELLDEVWVATRFVRNALAPHASIPVRVVPPPFPMLDPAPALTRAELRLPTGPVFLYSFDLMSTVQRKHPLGVAEAFRRAFPPGTGPTLVLKSTNGDERPEELRAIRAAVADRPDVVVMDGYLDVARRDALVAHSDAYVSLHRSEGLGLTIAEAMSCGRPVIATAYGGNTDFMTDRNSLPVPYSLVPIPADCAPYPAGSPWADPDLDVAARLMRRVIEEPAVAAALGAAASADIRAQHSAAAAGAHIRHVLALPRRRRRWVRDVYVRRARAAAARVERRVRPG